MVTYTLRLKVISTLRWKETVNSELNPSSCQRCLRGTQMSSCDIRSCKDCHVLIIDPEVFPSPLKLPGSFILSLVMLRLQVQSDTISRDENKGIAFPPKPIVLEGIFVFYFCVRGYNKGDDL